MKNKKVDKYISEAAPFARPILEKIRKLVHQACPQIEEDLKWGAPAFMREGIVAGMVAFKAHARFGFWKAKLMKDPEGPFHSDSASFMNAERLTDVKQLPADKVLIAYILEAVKLNESGAKAPRPKPTQRKPVSMPAYLKKALAGNAKAKATFEKFSPSCQREYVEWITEAKREETRRARGVSPPRWNGWRKENRKIGNISNAPTACELRPLAHRPAPPLGNLTALRRCS